MTTTTKTATAGDGCQCARGVTTSDACIDRLRNTGKHAPEHAAGLRNERGGEHQTLTDTARIAELEAEGLTHSDAVGVMEAEKLAWQAEPAAGEERGDLQLTYEVYDGKHGLFEGNLLVAVVGECVARSEQTRVLAQTIKTRVNNHTQLVAALRQARQLLAKSEVHHGYCLTIDAALRLAKDGE